MNYSNNDSRIKPMKTELTQEEKRIKIAEARGYKPLYDRDDLWVSPDGKLACPLAALPDYFNDLNACHEMETKLLTFGEKEEYGDELKKLISRYDETWFATASQRAEAFGKTLNLW